MKHTIQTHYATPEGIVVAASEEATGDGVVSFDGTAPVSATTEIDVAFDYTKLKACVLYASKAVTLKTNSSGAPDDTIALAAGQAITWTPASPLANPFTANVTKIYAVNASGTNVPTLVFRFLLDVTP